MANEEKEHKAKGCLKSRINERSHEAGRGQSSVPTAQEQRSVCARVTLGHK